MTDKDILKYFSKWKLIPWKRIDENIKEYLKNRFNDSQSLKESYLRIKYNIEIRPICPVCGNLVKFYGKETVKIFLEHCSTKCSTLDKNVIKKHKQTCLERYNNENYTNRELAVKHINYKKVRIKTKQTKLERYGNENFLNIEKAKQTKLERYGNENYNNKEKAKETCLKKYGYEYTFNSPIIKEKIKQTCLKKYGIENGGGSKEAQEKIKQTCLKKYGKDNCQKVKSIKEKTKQTCFKKYGVDNPLKSKIIKEKIKQTCLKKYKESHWTKSKYGKHLLSLMMSNEKTQEKRNNTLKLHNNYCKSKYENECYEILKSKYPDIKRQYRSKLYPFNCDFYIPSLDLYIEYQGSQFHNKHPFDQNNNDDLVELENLKIKDNNSIRTKNGKKSQYSNIIYVWTNLDVRKRNLAKQNNLNFIEFWNIDEVKEWLNKQ